jgi:hypothetical protein
MSSSPLFFASLDLSRTRKPPKTKKDGAQRIINTLLKARKAGTLPPGDGSATSQLLVGAR